MTFSFPSEKLEILRAPQPHGDHLEDAALGVVFGQCMGDAIGLLTEFMSKKDAHRVILMLLLCSFTIRTILQTIKRGYRTLATMTNLMVLMINSK